MFILATYIAACAGLTVYAVVWHLENRSPAWALVHDVVISWTWPIAIATGYRVRP